MVSVDALNAAGTVIVLEVTDRAPEDLRGLLAVQLGDADPLPGGWVLCWRINYAAAERFDVAGCHGVATEETLGKILASVHSAIEPL